MVFKAIGDSIVEVNLVLRFVKTVFPLVDRELGYWKEYLQKCPDKMLFQQAMASIVSKRFHAQGGCIFALYPGVDQARMTRFIVAIQTISDYLDNLCDRAGCQDEQAFRQLHRAMIEALDPNIPLSDYYSMYPYKDDGGYLLRLVNECRRQIAGMPRYDLVKEYVKTLAELYSDLQSLKHLSQDIREEKIINWANKSNVNRQEISCWEFAAATGSTLGIFVLVAAASNKELSIDEVNHILNAYFPWVGGLHILLDYFIDQNEDTETGDLNFVLYYSNPVICEERLNWFVQRAIYAVSELPNAKFHLTVINGLLALYLSDIKTEEDGVKDIGMELLRSGSKRAKILHKICCYLREKRIV